MKKDKTKKIILIIIIVLIIISLSVSFIVIKRNNDKSSKYNEIINEIIVQSKNWVNDNQEIFENTNITYLNLNELIKKGYIAKDILIDPYTNGSINGCINITYDKTNDFYTYEFVRQQASSVNYIY